MHNVGTFFGLAAVIYAKNTTQLRGKRGKHGVHRAQIQIKMPRAA
jgi:hypothetical protein